MMQSDKHIESIEHQSVVTQSLLESESHGPPEQKSMSMNIAKPSDQDLLEEEKNRFDDRKDEQASDTQSMRESLSGNESSPEGK